MKYTHLIAAGCFAASLLAAQEGKFERTLNVSGMVDLDAMTDAGGITVTAGPAGSVHIRAILKAHREWMGGGGADVEARIRRLEQNPPIHQTGNSIQVGHVGKGELRGISMRLEIATPPNTKLRARADSGGIRVDGIQGPVDIQTDSGGLEARNILSDVRAQTDSGGIHIRNVQGAAYARADSGGIEALDVAGNIDVQTDSGGIRLGQTKPGTIHAKADSGGAQVKLVSGAGYDVRASSDSGRVNVADITVRGNISRNHMEGKVRGGGPLVDVHVGSGTVTIE
jgi:hypothetical protein